MSDVVALLRLAWQRALTDFDLSGRMRARCEEVAKTEPRTTATRPLYAVVVGKAAFPMLQGALDAGLVYERVVVVVPDGAVDAYATAARVGAKVITAAHPIPDARSLEAGHALLDVARECAAKGGTLHALISGGASALACVPCEALDLERLANAHAKLLACGADVRAINVVRRHWSALKGGGLMRAAAPSRVVTFLVSDVLGGEAQDIGSGPSVCDPTTIAQAQAVLTRFAPELAALPMIETLKPDEVEPERSRVMMVADANAFVGFVAGQLEAEGLVVQRLPCRLGEPATNLATRLVDVANGLAEGDAVVQGVEASLVVTENAGRGGRATHVAALAAPLLPVGTALLAGATDGADGASGTGGALVTRAHADALGLVLSEAVQRLDTATVLERVGATLPAVSTGLNFADVVVVARGRLLPGS